MPLIPGHEGVGRVVEIGPADSPLKVGDRVALPRFGRACGHCRYCVGGRAAHAALNPNGRLVLAGRVPARLVFDLS